MWMLFRIITIVVLLALLAALPAFAGTVGWRMDGSGRYPSATPPLNWSVTDHVLWATSLPAWSNASPVLVGERILICAEPSILLCLDRSGKILWQMHNDYADLPDNGKLPPAEWNLPKTDGFNGYTSDTPVSDGKYVYAGFGNGVVACFTVDGVRQWTRFLEKPTNPFGHCCSPGLVGGTLIVQYISMFGLDAKTGTTRWQTAHPHDWGSPAVARLGTRDVIITDTGDIVNVADGTTLANTAMSLDYNSPLVLDGVLYCVSSNKARAFQLALTADGNVGVTRLWETTVNDDRYYASPLLVDGLLYAVNQLGVLNVLDAKNGTLVYAQHLNLGGTIFPTPILAGKTILLSSDTGKSVSFAPGRSYQELTRNIFAPYRSTPVCDGPRLYIRTTTKEENKLYCISE